MIEKLVSSKRVIAKVLADLNLSEDDIRISDWREWVGEALEKIGAITQFVSKVSGEGKTPYLEIKGHQAQLPCDLHQLNSVAYSFNCNGPWIPTRKATGSFAVWEDDCMCKGSCNFLGNCGCGCASCNPDRIIQDSILVQLMVDLIGDIDKTKALEILNTNQNAKTILSNLVNRHNGPIWNRNGVNWSRDIQYTIKPNSSYIMTNIPCGYLKLSYSAIALDEDGYPMVPDKVSYMEALYWYITMKFKYPEYLNGEMNREIYYDIRRSWNFYRNQAYAEALMPNVDEMESIKNAWIELYPEMNDHNSFYSTVGQKQSLHRSSYSGYNRYNRYR